MPNISWRIKKKIEKDLIIFEKSKYALWFQNGFPEFPEYVTSGEYKTSNSVKLYGPEFQTFDFILSGNSGLANLT